MSRRQKGQKGSGVNFLAYLANKHSRPLLCFRAPARQKTCPPAGMESTVPARSERWRWIATMAAMQVLQLQHNKIPLGSDVMLKHNPPSFLK
jgi:hypothetical protein